MRIEFDPQKNAKNISERELSFERAIEFNFNDAVVKQDIRKAYPEDRFIAIGFLGNGARLHVLCFTPIADGIRVISFRKAHTKEVKEYEQTFPHD